MAGAAQQAKTVSLEVVAVELSHRQPGPMAVLVLAAVAHIAVPVITMPALVDLSVVVVPQVVAMAVTSAVMVDSVLAAVVQSGPQAVSVVAAAMVTPT